MQGKWVQFLVRKLRSCKLSGLAKKKKEKKEKEIKSRSKKISLEAFVIM